MEFCIHRNDNHPKNRGEPENTTFETFVPRNSLNTIGDLHMIKKC